MSLNFSSIIKPLFKWSSNGIKKIEDGPNKGTILISKICNEAPVIGFHEIYGPPLDESAINRINNSLLIKLPDEYIDFLKKYNGIRIFSGALTIWGIGSPLMALDIISQNNQVIWTPRSLLLIGYYFHDGSYIAYDLADDKTTVIRCDRNSYKELNRWQSLYEFLESEIHRLSELFDEKGVKINEDSLTTPPVQLDIENIARTSQPEAYVQFRSKLSLKIPDIVHDLIKTVPFKKVVLGFLELHFFNDNELEEAQLGYRVDLDCQPLVGDIEGDWRDEWWVIAYEDLNGDPIFADISNDDFPIYTAMHGVGKWEPELISTTFKNFIRALSYIHNISVEMESHKDKGQTNISQETIDEVIKRIELDNKNSEVLRFWEDWMKLCNND